MGSQGRDPNPIGLMSLRIHVSLFVSTQEKGHVRTWHGTAVCKPGRKGSPQIKPEAS